MILRGNDSRGLRPQILLGKLAAQKLQIDSGARTSVRPIAYEPGQENKRIKYLGILKRRESHELAFLFLVVVDETSQRAVHSSGRLHTGRPLVINAGDERAICLGKRFDCGKNVFVSQATLVRGELRNAESQSGEEAFTLVDQARREFHTGKGNVAFSRRLAMFLLVAMRGYQVSAI